MKGRVIDWVCHPICSMGSVQCVWFGLIVLLNLKWKIAPLVFPPEPPVVFVLLSVGTMLLGAAGVLNPTRYALLATVLVAGERGWQAQQAHNPYTIGVWVILAGAGLTWDLFVLPILKPYIVRAIGNEWEG